MTICVKIHGKRRKLCTGDLDRLISIQDRRIKSPQQGSPDFTMVFEDRAINTDEMSPLEEGQIWAMVQTTGGKTIFDGVNDRVASHAFYIRYLDDLTAESWVLFDGNRYDIVHTEDLDERHQYIRLYCNLRGKADQSNTAV